MGILKDIMGKVACGDGDGANTGKLGCLSLFGQPTHLIAVKKGYVIPQDTDFNLEYITPLVQKGIMIPIIDASSFEETSAEDTYTTNTSGEKRLDLQGLPEYKLMFEEGHEFYRQLALMRSYKSFDYIIGDDEGNWMMAKTSSGDGVGFTAGHTTPEMRKSKVKGSNAESKALSVQFLNRLQYDINYGIIHADELDFTPQEIPTVNGVNLDYSEVPADADVLLKVRAVLTGDSTSTIEGLEDSDFLVTVDGVTVTISGVTEPTPGDYEITIPALGTGEIVAIDLFDSALNVGVVDSNSILYRSNSISETVIV